MIRKRDFNLKQIEGQMETDEQSKSLSIDLNDSAVMKYRMLAGNTMKLNSNLGTTMKLLDLKNVEHENT